MNKNALHAFTLNSSLNHKARILSFSQQYTRHTYKGISSENTKDLGDLFDKFQRKYNDYSDFLCTWLRRRKNDLHHYTEDLDSNDIRGHGTQDDK